MRVPDMWVAEAPELDSEVVPSGDYHGDLKADILWHHATRGEVWMWLMDGTTRRSEAQVGTVPDVGYQIIK